MAKKGDSLCVISQLTVSKLSKWVIFSPFLTIISHLC